MTKSGLSTSPDLQANADLAAFKQSKALVIDKRNPLVQHLNRIREWEERLVPTMTPSSRS